MEQGRIGMQRHDRQLKDALRHFRFLAESGLNFFEGFKSSRIITRCECSLPLNHHFSKRLDVLLSA